MSTVWQKLDFIFFFNAVFLWSSPYSEGLCVRYFHLSLPTIEKKVFPLQNQGGAGGALPATTATGAVENRE